MEGKKTKMADSKHLLRVVLLLTLSQSYLVLGRSEPYQELSVPSDAKPGHVITMFNNGVHRVRMPEKLKQEVDPQEDYSNYFSLMDQGHLITTQNISHLDGKRVSLNLEHDHPTDPAQSYSTKFNLHITSEPLSGPQFTKQPYKGSLLENMPPGSVVTQLQDLMDALGQFPSFPDLTFVSGDTDKFKLETTPEFNSSSEQGLVLPNLVAMDTFNREERPDYSVTIEARSGNQAAYAIIQVDIEDINEHAPKFDLPTYQSELPADFKSFQNGAQKLLSVLASDADADDVTYSLEDTLGDLFKIDPFKGDIGLNMESMMGDMERTFSELFGKSFELQVHADDGRGRKDSTLVQVGPVFFRFRYTLLGQFT